MTGAEKATPSIGRQKLRQMVRLSSVRPGAIALAYFAFFDAFWALASAVSVFFLADCFATVSVAASAFFFSFLGGEASTTAFSTFTIDCLVVFLGGGVSAAGAATATLSTCPGASAAVAGDWGETCFRAVDVLVDLVSAGAAALGWVGVCGVVSGFVAAFLAAAFLVMGATAASTVAFCSATAFLADALGLVPSAALLLVGMRGAPFGVGLRKPQDAVE